MGHSPLFYWSFRHSVLLIGRAEKTVSNAEKIQELIAPLVEALGYDLVRVAFTGAGQNILQVMAERPDGGMNVNDCATLSREISALLDVEDPIPGEYSLEVSSPGIDRPLTRAKDFERFAGSEAKVECRVAINGQRRFKGRLKGLAGDDILIETAVGEVAVPLAEVIKAKLLVGDAGG